MRAKPRWIPALIAGALALFSSGSAPTIAHGAVDQELTGNPACNGTDFKGSTSSASPIRQEFVPAEPGLAGVELCLNIGTAGTPVTINIRNGTAASPAATIATATATAAATGYQWLHIDLADVQQVVPGAKYVIEVPSSATFAWNAKCGEVSLPSCPSIDPDAYPPGVSTRTGGADFGFRTRAVELAIPPTGVADQKLLGDPSCGPGIFRGFTSSATPIRQEFVPVANGLGAVDLCINVVDASATLTINIRTGTAAVPGAILQSAAAAGSQGYQWLRVPLAPVLATTPGTMYVIEIPSSFGFQWRAKCGQVSGSCTSLDLDTYLPGASTRAGGADFGFRTIPGVPPGTPIGTADQNLTGDPACNAIKFVGFVSSPSPFRQEFVPSTSARGLAAVDLCVNIATVGTEVTVNVRTGTALAPGPILATASVTATETGLQFLRLDLPAVVPTSAASKYVIEVPASVTFQWRGTCGAIVGACAAVDTDRYPLGGTNSSLIGDFGFRTIAGTPFMRFMALVAADGIP